LSDFELTVAYKGKQETYTGQLLAFGYSYKIIILIGDTPVTFEPDEERNFRAIVPPEQVHQTDPNLLQLLAEEIELNLK
jgi:hypothetical protein